MGAVLSCVRPSHPIPSHPYISHLKAQERKKPNWCIPDPRHLPRNRHLPNHNRQCHWRRPPRYRRRSRDSYRHHYLLFDVWDLWEEEKKKTRGKDDNDDEEVDCMIFSCSFLYVVVVLVWVVVVTVMDHGRKGRKNEWMKWDNMYDGMRLWDMYLCIIMMFSVCNGFSVWFWFQSSCTYHISMDIRGYAWRQWREGQCWSTLLMLPRSIKVSII